MTRRHPLHQCEPSRRSPDRSEGSTWKCEQCGSGWHLRSNGRWGRDGDDFRIEVPRHDRRLSLEKCRADAQTAARSQGFIGPPDEVISYDGALTDHGDALTHPQGYIFTWYAPDSEETRPTQKSVQPTPN